MLGESPDDSQVLQAAMYSNKYADHCRVADKSKLHAHIYAKRPDSVVTERIYSRVIYMNKMYTGQMPPHYRYISRKCYISNIYQLYISNK